MTPARWKLSLGLVLCGLGVLPTGAAAGSEDDAGNGYQPYELEANRAAFTHVHTVEDGLGPAYNGRSCVECHDDPAVGGSSPRTGRFSGHVGLDGQFVPADVSWDSEATWMRGGLLGAGFSQAGAICAEAEMTVHPGNVDSHRVTPSLLGLGYVEAIADETLLALAAKQARSSDGIAGEVVYAPVFEAGFAGAVGRLGWKNEMASVRTFAAVAYLAELGITNALLPGEFVWVCDTVEDPEDVDGDLDRIAAFIRSTRAPERARDTERSELVQAGEKVFERIGCGICHVPTLRTAPAGTLVNAGTFEVPEALGGQVIHPYGDFLLHDVGTGDGHVFFGLQSTQEKFRTAPLWGVRHRVDYLMHDGQSRGFHDAITRHGGEAAPVVEAYEGLGAMEHEQLRVFLSSL